MVDANTVKPGDIVELNEYVSSLDMTNFKSGQKYIVGDPAFLYFNSVIYLNVSPYGFVLKTPNGLDIVGERYLNSKFFNMAIGETEDNHMCTCDTFSVLMVSGCKCGYMEQERRNQN